MNECVMCSNQANYYVEGFGLLCKVCHRLVSEESKNQNKE